MIQSPVPLTALLLAVAALSFWLDRNVRVCSALGASLLALIFGAVMSNAGLVAPASPVYDVATGPVTSLAIAWLLLAVDLRDLKRAGRTMTVAFALAVVGTAVGCFVAAMVFGGVFEGDTWRIAGTMAGTYSGGSLNFVAVGRAVELPDSLFAGATAADNVTTALWLGATLVLPLWLRRLYPTPIPGVGGNDAPEGSVPAARGGAPGQGAAEMHPYFRRIPLSTLDLSLLVAAGFGLVLLADLVAGLVPGIPSVVWLTTFALVLGNSPLYRRPPGAMQLGNLALTVFFVVIGIFSRFAEIATVGVEILLFTLVVVGIHGLIIYGAGRFLSLDLGTLSVASQAAVGGPGGAIAVAAARGWQGLVLPGIIVGLLGYAVGNYVGLAVAYAARGLGAGF